jgi:geranylgeranyl diphosphate synthase, type II
VSPAAPQPVTQASVLDELTPWRARVDAMLELYVGSVSAFGTPAPKRLTEAMAHTLLAGGKRLRPMVVLAAAHATRKIDGDALFHAAGPACVAVEMLHTYSLVHDDLPALDDDGLRRGRPTVHVAYDEATAVLAGDALLTDAFLHLARAPKNAAQQIEALALATGSAGMVGGQHDDMQGATDLHSLPSIHLRKTAFLFAASAEMGVLAAGGEDALRQPARDYGIALGLAFQIWDDVLDVVGDPDRSGKGTGRDAKNDKVTFVTLLGEKPARARALELVDEAIKAAQPFSSTLLDRLARFAVERDH